jgi:hypothetical protein
VISKREKTALTIFILTPSQQFFKNTNSPASFGLEGGNQNAGEEEPAPANESLDAFGAPS